MKTPTYIDGIASSQAIDTAGEIVDLKGLDISSLIGAATNWEHQKDLPAQIVGKILEAKKIFSVEDCENDRQAYYWNKCQTPFLYIMARLFDDRKPSSVEVAALFQDDAAHPEESDMVGFSIEGAKIEKIGAVVTRSIARKCTITHIPANKQCIAEMLPQPDKKSDDLSSIFKGEMELFKFEPTYIEILKKKESEIPTSLNEANEALEKAGWTGHLQHTSATMGMAGTHFEHPKHGKVSVTKTSVGNFEVRHNDKLIGVSQDAHKAGLHAKKHMAGLGKMEDLNKALEAGSAMAAPSQLVGGAALGKEGMEKKLHKKEKSKWSDRADKAYEGWSDREKFRGYMSKRMPHLAGGEVDAIGRLLALKKDMDKEGKLSKMYASYFGKKEGLMVPPGHRDDKETETGHETGIHTQSVTDKPGISPMGKEVRRAKALANQGKAGYGGHYKANFKAKMQSETTSKQAAAIPSPNLKSDKLDKTSDVMMASEDKNKKK